MAETSDPDRPADLGRLPRDLGVGIAILAFCAVAYVITLGFDEAPAALAQNVQPATFPRMVIGVITAMTLLMMALGLGQPSRRKALPALMVPVTGAMMLGFVLAFDTLGAFEAMVLFALVMPVLWGARNPVALIGFALLFPFAVYLVFVGALGLFFEPGVVFDVRKGLF
ncbi:MAG: tripartite tricarboxylate transporter TctB family protein [Pseudomonadota bacterium]